MMIPTKNSQFHHINSSKSLTTFPKTSKTPTGGFAPKKRLLIKKKNHRSNSNLKDEKTADGSTIQNIYSNTTKSELLQNCDTMDKQ